jgi:hypothetical protein
MGCSRDQQAWACWWVALLTREGRVRWEPAHLGQVRL